MSSDVLSHITLSSRFDTNDSVVFLVGVWRVSRLTGSVLEAAGGSLDEWSQVQLPSAFSFVSFLSP